MIGDSEYNNLVENLDDLIDQAGEDEAHPISSLIDDLSVLIEKYENANVPELLDIR